MREINTIQNYLRFKPPLGTGGDRREAISALHLIEQRLADARGEGPFDDPVTFCIRVAGVECQTTYLPTNVRAFEEEYEITADHAAQALLQLVGEIEWGILDSEQEFSITVRQKE